MTKDERQLVARKLFKLNFMNSGPAVPAGVYLLMASLDVPFMKALLAVLVFMPFNMVLVGNLAPYLLIQRAVEVAFAEIPGEAPGARLSRILKLPRWVEFQLFFIYVASATAFLGVTTIYFHTSAAPMPLGVLGFVLLILIMFIRQGVEFEKVLRPYAIAEFNLRPDVKLRGSGLFWTRQRWYLPYTYALFILCTVVSLGLIVGRKYRDGFSELLESFKGNPEVIAKIHASLTETTGSLIAPLLLVGGFVLGIALWAGWLLAQQQQQAAVAVKNAIESLAFGQPKLPDWISSDEIGDLSSATAAVFEQMRVFSHSLKESAMRLGASAEELGASTSRQNQILTLQASALQETQVTAQEIKQTSALASQKAEGVLEQTAKVDHISHAGDAAIEQSLLSLKEIRQVVQEMASRIRSLEERMRQIGNITTTVKDLADQSNMLALNAAIEAVRAGDHGKGFGVVAREIRSLADQSIRSTHHVRDILQDIVEAIRETVGITEKGTKTVDQGLEQIRVFGDNMREMAGIVRDNATSVRQISAAVTQQNAGISQIFQAVTDLSRMMDETLGRLRTTDNASTLVREVAEQVSGFVGRFNWSDQLPPEQKN